MKIELIFKLLLRRSSNFFKLKLISNRATKVKGCGSYINFNFAFVAGHVQLDNRNVSSLFRYLSRARAGLTAIHLCALQRLLSANTCFSWPMGW